MKVKLITEIDVHEDGVHCGEGCPLLTGWSNTESAACALDPQNRLKRDITGLIRCLACLAAQKDAEGMTWGVIGKDEPSEGIIYLVFRERLQLYREAYYRNECWELTSDPVDKKIPTPIWNGDRFYPVPKEKENK